MCPSTVCTAFDKIVCESVGVWPSTPLMSLVGVRIGAMYDNIIELVCYVESCEWSGTVIHPVDLHLLH